MSDWTSGYMAEIDYTHDFFHDLAPSHLALAAVSKGQRPPFDRERPQYCELGCGQGFSANLLAAANPHIDFHAMDFNPSHIANATSLAQAANLPNMRFHECSFEEFDDVADLPSHFDVIVLHGVMSWVSQENRKHIVSFLSKRLRPGGMVYLSYNALAGWTASLPLRRLLLDHANRNLAPISQRIEDALCHAERVAQSGAKLFSENPAAAARLKSLRGKSARYLAHELFNKDWTPFHFGDLTDELSQAKLQFVGSSSFFEQVEDICLTPEQSALLSLESDIAQRESLRDVMVNEQFRSDLFVKGTQGFTERGAIGAWFDSSLALTQPYGGGPLKLKWRLGEIALEQQQYAPLLEALKSTPMTVKALLERGVFGAMTWQEISRMLRILIGAQYISPALPQALRSASAEQCQRFNQEICKRAEDSEELQFLASPVTGSGIAADRLEQLFLLAQSEGLTTPEDWAALTWRILAPQGQRLKSQGRVLESDEENLAFLRARAHSFAARRLPLFEMLGLTLPVSASQFAQDCLEVA